MFELHEHLKYQCLLMTNLLLFLSRSKKYVMLLTLNKSVACIKQRFPFYFKANPKGTFWYHSHIGGQRIDGLFGAFIIKPKSKTNDNNVEDVIMHVGDWFHSRSSEVNYLLDFCAH